MTVRPDPLAAFQDRLGVRFRDEGRLRAALTHSSTGVALNYERLEFLGDRVLGLVIAALLYETYPRESEGDLARRHAALVQGSTLAAVARAVDLGAALQLSEAERAAGGADNDNILSDGMEAVFGALYLDAGLEPCREIITRLWAEALRTMRRPPRDPKTALQEWAQGRGLGLPLYEMAGRSGPDHAPLFDVRVTVTGYAPVTAGGPSRRAAEKEAARLLLCALEGEAP